MPYTIRKVKNVFKIIKKTTGEVVGKSNSRKMAEASIRARYAGENNANKS